MCVISHRTVKAQAILCKNVVLILPAVSELCLKIHLRARSRSLVKVTEISISSVCVCAKLAQGI